MKYRRMQDGRWQEFPKLSCKCGTNYCARHQISIPVEKDSSCTRCIDCDDFAEIINGTCKLCPMGYKPLHNRSGCEAIPEQSFDHLEPWSVAAVVIAVSGENKLITRIGMLKFTNENSVDYEFQDWLQQVLYVTYTRHIGTLHSSKFVVVNRHSYHYQGLCFPV